ncbi:MAG: alpha/beta fold hydrolase [Paracoccaceae bacterium]
MPFADLPGIRLHYEIGGNGPPLILIAGMMSDSASWGPIVAPLEQRFTVIRPDNRTCGRTVPQDAPAGLAEWAGDAVALLGHLRIARAHVAGHSLGGLIALQMAALAPARVDRLVLLATAPVRLQRNLAIFRHLLALRGPGMSPDLWLRGLFPWLFHPATFDDPGAIEAAVAQSLAYPHAQPPAAMARQLAALEQADVTMPDPLPPTLAILGASDLLFPRHLVQDSLKGARIVEIANAAHSVHWDAPDAVVTRLVDHLEGRV